MRSCEQVLEWISAELDGELSEPDLSALHEHLEHCPACSALYQELAGLSGALEELAASAPDGFVQNVMARIAAEAAQEGAEHTVIPFPAKKRTPWKGWAASAAVVAVVVLGAVSLPGLLTGGTGGGAGADSAAIVSAADAGDAGTAGAAGGSANTEAESQDNLRMDMEKTLDDNSVDSAGNDASALQPSAAPESADGQPGAMPFSAANSADETQQSQSLCGVLLITAQPLPDGMEEYTGTRNDQGQTEYLVPADYFFTALQELGEQELNNFSDTSADREDVDPEAGYGLIIVDLPET